MSKSKLDVLKAVYQWVTRTMMKNQTGVMQTLPNRDLIELNTQITAQRLMQAGVDPTTLKNANQVENAINIIESRPVQEGIKSTKAGKVFDMEGQEIPQGSRIMGGKAVKETEEEILARMNKENKEAAERIRRKQKETMDDMKEIEDPEDMATGGRAGFNNGGAPSIVLNPEERAMDKEFETSDVKEAIKEIIKRSIGPLDMAEIPLTEKGNLRFGFDSSGDRQISGGLNLLGGELNFGAGKGKQGRGVGFEFKKRFADGGRIGLKDGMSRRQFMKIMGGIASLPFIGKYIKPAMPLIQKGAEITAPALDKIVQTVMSAGKLISQSGRRVKEMVTKKKLKDVEVEEDIMDGPSYTIKTKDKTIYYRPGRQDEMGIEDDVIEVIEDTVTKKAGGGIARMLGE